MYIKEHEIEVLMLLFATLCTISALIISHLYPEIQVLTLTILTVLLPMIYQIGHIYSKVVIRKQQEKDIEFLNEESEMKDDYIEDLENENSELAGMIENKE